MDRDVVDRMLNQIFPVVNICGAEAVTERAADD
jgi:hypothetical protein